MVHSPHAEPRPTLRRATPSDATALAALAERTFRDTFEAQNDPADMALHCRTTYGEALQRAELLDARRVTLVCETEGRLVAFAQLRWEAAPVALPTQRPGEIQRFYLDQAWHGRGLAQELMRACLETLAQGGADLAWLGVWESNPRALAFYRKTGFEVAGHHVFPLGTDLQRDLIMARPLLA